MQLIYSAFNPENCSDTHKLDHVTEKQDFFVRYDAYWHTCNKFKSEISEIRKYFPGWMPNPPKF